MVEADGSDPLGFDAPDTAKRPFTERAARVKYQVGKMMEGHAGKQARRESALTPKTVSTTDFVVRTRAQILADQKAKEEKEKVQASATSVAPAATTTTSVAPAATTTTPIAEPSSPVPAVTNKNENSFDEDLEDEGAGDDSDFKDGSTSVLSSSQTSPRLTESWSPISHNPPLFVCKGAHNHVHEWAVFISHPLGE